jgi:hypothetical protein
VPELLTLELLERLDRTLRGVGAAIVDHWEPGLTRAQMDALTEPHGFRLPDEAALWWSWHNGSSTSELMPTRRMLSLETAVQTLVTVEATMEDLYGLSRLLAVVNEQPWLWFDCRGAHDAPVPVYVTGMSGQPSVAAESIGDMVRILIAGLEAGAYSTDDNGKWNEPNWDIVEADKSGIL